MSKAALCALPSLKTALHDIAQQVGRLDARLLLAHVCGLSHAQLITADQRALSPDEHQQLKRLVQRRCNGEPLAYVLGEAGFLGRLFKVSPAVLVPRPETEELVERALKGLNGISRPRVLDLGTGSGAIAISVALECPDASVVAVDVSADALMVARSNGARLGAQIDWRQGSWFDPISNTERFDLIISNPPYIAADDPHLAGDGVCVEPRLALTDGGDGLDCLRAIIANAPHYLADGGHILLEHGHDQGLAVRNLLDGAKLKAPRTWADLSGNDRISGAVYASPVYASQNPPYLTRVK